MSVSSANPDALLRFERDTRGAFGDIGGCERPLGDALQRLRASEDAKRFLAFIPMLETEVGNLRTEGQSLATWVGDIGRRFRAADEKSKGVIALDDSQLASVPRLGNGTFTVRRVNGRVIIDTGDGDDQVSITRVDGGVRITVNGVPQDLKGVDADNVTVRLGGGNDRLEVATDVTLHFTIEGQDGKDKLEGGAGADDIRGGAGRDYIDGYRGDDRLDGGDGNDVIYAGDGNDVVSGGSGIDYLEGGTGDDVVLGGGDHDILSGGDGSDRLDGGGGDDTIYAGAGADRVSDYQGTNQAFVQLGDDTVDWTLGDGTTNVVNVDLSGLPGDSALRIEGSDRFKQRILQDLAMLRSSPDGRKMLLAMDDIHEDTKAIAADWPILGGVAYQGDTITIREYPGDDNSTSSYRGAPFDLWRSNEIKQSRSITELYPGTEAAWQETPPVVVLFHELAHQYDYGYETRIEGDYNGPDDPGVPNREREAVGLPVDHDGDPSTPNQIAPGHPTEYTENGLRREMGLPDRESYGSPPR